MNALDYILIIISICWVIVCVATLVWFGSLKQAILLMFGSSKQKVSQTDIDTKDIDTIEKNQEEIPPLKQKLSQNNKDLDALKTNIQTIVKDIHTIKTFLKRDKRRDTWKRET